MIPVLFSVIIRYIADMLQNEGVYFMAELKVSIVVPVYNVEPHIKHCLETLVHQTLDGIEIIVVNDGSPDNSQSIIDEYAAKYPNLIFPYIKENGGLSDARNYGMKYARGEYIGFVDSDDFVEETMFEKLYTKAAEDDADIVVCGYNAIDEIKRVIKRLQMGNREHFGKSLFDNPKLLYINAPYAWNKLFRRKMLEEYQIKFPKGLIFEDIATTYPAFLCANKISKVDEALYHYYLKREGSITGTYSRKFAQVLDSLSHMNDFYKNQKRFVSFFNVLLFINLKHIINRFVEFSLYSDREFQLQFLNDGFRHLNHYFPGWKNYQHFFTLHYKNRNKKLLTSMNYWKFVIYCPNWILLLAHRFMHELPSRVRSLRKKTNNMLQLKTHFRHLYTFYYKHANVRKNVVLFESFHGRTLSDSPFYMMKQLAQEKKYTIFFTTNNLETHRQFVKENKLDITLVPLHSLKYQKLLASAKYLINNVSFPPYFIKKPDQIYLNTWHGTPLKTLGKNMRKGISDMHNIQHNFLQSDYLLFPNKFTMDCMMRDYNLEDLYTGKALLAGYPRNAAFFEDAMSLRKQLHLENKTVFAYMPTWRGEKSSKLSTAAYKKRIGQMLAALDSRLYDDQILFVNLHPLLQNAVRLQDFKHIRAFPSYIDNYAFLNCCDALITDYSSVFFDFAITGKPVVLFMYDYEEYMSNRGVYFDIRTLPFTQLYVLDELCDYLCSFPAQVRPYTNETMFRYQFLRYEHPQAAKDLIDFVFHGQASQVAVFDYAKNKNRELTLYLPHAHPLAEELEPGVEKNTVTAFLLQNFTQTLNEIIYEQYIDSLPFIVVSGKTPLTHWEHLQLHMNRKKAQAIRSRVYRRELQRILPNLQFSAVNLSHKGNKFKALASVIASKEE